jgi:microcystin-dependent protein
MSRKHAKFIRSALLGAATVAPLLAANQASAQSTEPFIGELKVVGFNFCPRGYLPANGQILSIAQNTALFALVGTTFGGNGQTTFALPNLQGRAPIHFGQGAGLSNYSLGQLSGTESTTLNVTNLPAHTHRVLATNVLGDKGGPGDKILGAKNADPKPYMEGTPNRQMAADMITVAGGSQPVDILRPYLAMNICIATEGVFPSPN